MADKTEFLQAIDDAILDADSLEKFINGSDSETVLTRLSAEYPTLQKAIKELFEHGGLPATPFATKALMTASALVDGDYAMVTNDTDNNGLYVKTAGAWVKSSYDPVAQAKTYTDNADIATLGSARSYTDDESLNINTKIDNLIVNDGSNKGLFYVTKDGFPIIYVLNNGDLHVQGFEKPVQEYLVGEYGPEEEILASIDDADGSEVIRFHKNSDISLRGMSSTIKQKLKELKASSTLAISVSKMNYPADRATIINAAADVDEDGVVSKLHMIQPKEDVDGVARIPSILPLANNKILYIYGEGGDGSNVKMYKRILTYTDEGGLIEIGEKELIRKTVDPEGIAKHSMLCRDANGRIVMVFDEKDLGAYSDTAYRKLVCFSTDEGESFTEPFIVPYPDWHVSGSIATGSTGNMELLSTGRIVCPLYTLRNGAIATMYSDDNGESWEYSMPFEDAYLNEGVALQEPATATLANDDILFSCRTPSKDADGKEYMRKYMCISRDGGETIEGIGIIDDLVSPPCASSMLYDKERGFLIHSSPTAVDDRTGYNFQLSGRKRYRLQLSSNGGTEWKVACKPLEQLDSYMIAYSHIVKLKKDLYAVAVEGLSNVATTNSQESCGLLIINLKGVFANVVNS